MTTRSIRLCFYYAILGAYIVFQVVFFKILQINNEAQNSAFKVLEIYKELAEKLNKQSQVDYTGLYKFVHSKKMENKATFDVTLISQCSSNHFPSVENLFKVWEGSISVAVYSEVENIESTLWDMARFMYCHRSRNFGMQLVVPLEDVYVKDFEFAHQLVTNDDGFLSCSTPYISTIKGKKNYSWKFPYPVNLLRNIAKSGATTDFILVLDIDMVPSRNLTRNFLRIVKDRKPKNLKAAYVLPAFEILANLTVPKDKEEMFQLTERFMARPFYFIPCEDCQAATDYMKWFSQKPSEMVMMYEVEWKHPWEPFFITNRDAPDYDERFKQYGMNRVSQICELYVAGFVFIVLNDGFVVHRGFKTENDFHATKAEEMKENRKVYNRFKLEVIYKYPDVDRHC